MALFDNYILGVLVLALSYTLTFGYCMYQTNKFGYFKDEWRRAKLFYFSVIIQCFIRMTTYALLTFAVKQDQRSHAVILVMRSVPDTLFFLTYALLVYQTVNIFYQSHRENRLHISLLEQFTRGKFRRTKKIYTGLAVVWLGLMGLMYALLILKKITGTDIQVEFIIVDILSATLVLIYMSYLYSKYSETPFKSLQQKKNLSYTTRILLVWTVGRYLKGVIGLIDFETASIFDYMSNPEQSNIGSSIIYIVDSIFCEIYCFIRVMNPRFINIFISQETVNLMSNEEESFTETEELKENDSFILDINKITDKTIFSKRNNGLGELFTAKINGREILYRQITFPKAIQLSLEDIRIEIETLASANQSGVSYFYGSDLSFPDVYLYYQHPGKSLFNLIHGDTTVITLKMKINILKETASILKDLHEKGIFHGHLTSFNIILAENNKPSISDIGLNLLKKYASLTIGYSNKTPWSSPEIWNDTGAAVLNPQPSDDVYSLGMIIWEVLTGDIPYSDTKYSDLLSEIAVNGKMPRIPCFFPKNIKQILKMCWARAADRPKISIIHQKLALLRFKKNNVI